MSAMRHAVTVSRMREGRRLMDLSLAKASGIQDVADIGKLSIDWKEALFLGTRGGAEALGLKSGTFTVGAPFDAQQSRYSHQKICVLLTAVGTVQLINPNTSDGFGPIDFLDNEGTDISKGTTKLSLAAVEKWFCLGDVRNRVAIWIQGKKLSVTI